MFVFKFLYFIFMFPFMVTLFVVIATIFIVIRIAINNFTIIITRNVNGSFIFVKNNISNYKVLLP